MDESLAAAACSNAQLRRAVARHTLSERGSFSLLISRHRSATAPGLVQVVGRLLRPGAVLRFRGAPAKDEVVVLNCFVSDHEFQLRLSSLRIRAKAKARIVLTDGRPRVVLSRMKAKVRVTVVGPSGDPKRR
jgi:hypothetical protein